MSLAPPSGPAPLPNHTLADFSYELPGELVAQAPALERTHARLMLMERNTSGECAHHRIAGLPDLVRGDELFVFNDTRVVPARLLGRKSTGGRVELLVLEEKGAIGMVLAMGRSSKALRPGTDVELSPGVVARVVDVLQGGLLHVRLPIDRGGLWAFLDKHGHLPLPPYIRREDGPTAEDRDRYQTVFARSPGSVAAPTAGLHFTEDLLDAVRARGCDITHLQLHVGPGTFSPVRTEQLSEHVMHAERFHVPTETATKIQDARRHGRPVLAVGTTVVRTLEAVAQSHGEVVPGGGETRLFITPGWPFRAVDQLITNFHLPGSTLLMLVCAFAGHQPTLGAYHQAVSARYRFFSYGDGMWIR